MSRPAALALLMLAVAGCKSEPRNVIVATPPPPAAPPAAATVIDDEVVRRFVVFDKQYLAALPARMAQMRDQLAAAEKTGGKAGAGAPDQGAAHDVLQRMNAEDAKLRAAAGLTQEQAQVLQDLSMAIAAARKNAADLTAKIDGARAGLAKVPPDQRPALETELQSLERHVREVRALAGVRRRYGEAAVDAAMRHEAELAPLWDQQMQVFQQAMKLMATGK